MKTQASSNSLGSSAMFFDATAIYSGGKRQPS
jgi:hypothetical protein